MSARLSLALAVAGLTVAALPSAAHATDSCSFFYLSNQSGQQWTAYPPSVTSSYSSLSPTANTSTRYNEADLYAYMPGMVQDIRSLQIVAQDSDVAAYVHVGADFSDNTLVFHCEKGNVCKLDDLGWYNDRVRSIKCQREFGRKANGGWVNELTNPIIDTEDIRSGFEAQANSIISGSSSVASYTHVDTSMGWLAMSELCRARGWACSSSWYTKYRDLMLLEHDFELTPSGWAWAYKASIGYNLEPRLDSQGDLEFWQAERSVWVESGWWTSAIEDGLTTALNTVDLPSELRQTILETAGNQICPSCSTADKLIWGAAAIDNKDRYQMSYFNSGTTSPYPTDADFVSFAYTYHTPAYIVLNNSRQAQ